MNKLPLMLLLSILTMHAESLTRVSPEQVGLSSERLSRIRPIMEKHVAAGRVAGAIGLIARHGKIAYLETYGQMDKEAGKPMREDTLFRIYSMTKAVTGVAAMILYEEGRYSLNDPVAKYIPEFGGLKVAVDKRLVSSDRDMTIRDLMRHTSGLNYVGPRDEAGNLVYQKLKVADPDVPLAEMVKRLSQSPLVHQPGTIWDYSLGIDVLGRVVEVASGQTLDRFFEERIFKPLRMKDTGFYVPKEKWDRLAALYVPNTDLTIHRSTGRPQESFKKKPVQFLGGAGLVSTVTDYARFCQMLLGNGELDGARVLSPKSVELMSANHLGNLPSASQLLRQGYGFGLTFAVNLGPGKTGRLGSEGEYNWGGAAGTKFSIDPKEQMFTVFMIQILPHTTLTYGEQFRDLVYQAIVK